MLGWERYRCGKIGSCVRIRRDSIGSLRLRGRDNVLLQAIYGAGIARHFFNDTKNLNLDAGYDSLGFFRAQLAYGGYATIQHFWNDQWRSTVAYRFLQVGTTEASAPDTYKRTQYQYVDCNPMYGPVGGITLVEDFSGASGSTRTMWRERDSGSIFS